MPTEFQDRITVNPKMMAGKPVIRGTRIPVDLIVRMVAQGMPMGEIIEDYPNLHIEDIQAALWYAAALVSQDEVYPMQLASV